jgi:hypothetical protein
VSDDAVLSRRPPASNEQEPCDPERLKVLEEAVREALRAYLAYTDPHNRVSRDEALGQLIEILDRREVAEAAEVDVSEAAVESERVRSPRRAAH